MKYDKRIIPMLRERLGISENLCTDIELYEHTKGTILVLGLQLELLKSDIIKELKKTFIGRFIIFLLNKLCIIKNNEK